MHQEPSAIIPGPDFKLGNDSEASSAAYVQLTLYLPFQNRSDVVQLPIPVRNFSFHLRIDHSRLLRLPASRKDIRSSSLGPSERLKITSLQFALIF